MKISFKMFVFAGFLYSMTATADVWDSIEAYSLENQENEGVEDYVWKETGSQLPAYPQEDDLLEVSGPPAYRNYQYLIDSKSLTVGADRVVRYSIVIRSSSGSDNVMYDGLRCIVSQIKNYAYGTTGMDGKKKLIAREGTDWGAFRTTGATGYAPILASDYFCDHSGSVLKRHEIIQNIKYGKGPVDGLYY